FADRVVQLAAPGATVWVHDYQLQLVPQMVRSVRPDVHIGFFLHIPFPAYGLFLQLPWRRQVLEGLLGADVIGFQRVQDAINFRTVVRRLLKFPIRQNQVLVPTASLGESSSAPGSEAWLNNHVVNRYYRDVTVKEFPISIDTQ